MADDKIYSDPREILAAIAEGVKKAFDARKEQIESLAKGELPHGTEKKAGNDDKGSGGEIKKDPSPLKKDLMSMGQPKNKVNMPRGPYTGKTAITAAPKAPVAPKAPAAPKAPVAPKIPSPPKPPMAKGESVFRTPTKKDFHIYSVNEDGHWKFHSKHNGTSDSADKKARDLDSKSGYSLKHFVHNPETHDLVHHVVDRHTGTKIGTFKKQKDAADMVNKKDKEHGEEHHDVVTEQVPKMAKTEELAKEHIGFDKLTHKLEGKGNSAESAKKIAAVIGEKKYGKEGMAHKAAKARKSEKDMSKHAADGDDGKPIVMKKDEKNPAISGMKSAVASMKESVSKLGSPKASAPDKTSASSKHYAPIPTLKTPTPHQNYGEHLYSEAKKVPAPTVVAKQEVAPSQDHEYHVFKFKPDGNHTLVSKHKDLKSATKAVDKHDKAYGASAHFYQKVPSVKKEETLEKAGLNIKDKAVSTHMNHDAFKAYHAASGSQAPSAPKLPSQQEHVSRHDAFSSFMPKGKFDKAEMGHCALCLKGEHDGEC